jgi:predicted ArsR family transcriptional regulator
LEESLREVGRLIGVPHSAGSCDKLIGDRVEAAAKALESIGGSPKIEAVDGKLLIRSSSCPFAAVAAHHLEVCGLAQALVARIVTARVDTYCDHSGSSPKCCFEITAS